MAHRPAEVDNFKALVASLVDEYERVLGQNRELQAENSRFRGGGSALLHKVGAAAPPDASDTARSFAADSAGNQTSSSISGSVELGVPPWRQPPTPLLRWQEEASYMRPSDESRDKEPVRTSSTRSSINERIVKFSTHGRKLSQQMIRVHSFLDDPESSTGSRVFGNAMQLLILASVAVPLVQTIQPPLLDELGAAAMDAAFDVFFVFESLLRLGVHPAPRLFFFNLFNLIDLVSVPALVLRICFGFAYSVGEGGERRPVGVTLLCFVPILRLLKMLRRWDTIHLLKKAFVNGFQALPILLFPLLVLTLSFAALIYLVEPHDNIPTLPEAMWLTIVTMTTVGYGDKVPKSTAGHFVVGALVICSLLYMAMPLAIVGASFTEVWQERKLVLLVNRTQQRLTEWGYTAQDIPELFKMFSKSKTGQLNVGEFNAMVKAMRLGLKDKQILQLFKLFDGDGSGNIDDRELVRVLYPNKFLDIYGDDGDPEVSEDAKSNMEMDPSEKVAPTPCFSRESTVKV